MCARDDEGQGRSVRFLCEYYLLVPDFAGRLKIFPCTSKTSVAKKWMPVPILTILKRAFNDVGHVIDGLVFMRIRIDAEPQTVGLIVGHELRVV